MKNVASLPNHRITMAIVKLKPLDNKKHMYHVGKRHLTIAQSTYRI